MNLAHYYARVSKEVDPAALFSYIKKRGHLTLLPQIVRILEREKESGDTVTVAREADIAKFKRSDRGSDVLGSNLAFVIDPRIVGGTIVRRGSTVINRSYRSALIELYRRITL